MLSKKVSIKRISPCQNQDTGPPYEILYFQHSQLLNHNRILHAVFTRQGGVSRFPYCSLNTSYRVGDRSEKVDFNLHLIKEVLGAIQLKTMDQVHGQAVSLIRRNDPQDPQEIPEADAMITDLPGTAPALADDRHRGRRGDRLDHHR